MFPVNRGGDGGEYDGERGSLQKVRKWLCMSMTACCLFVCSFVCCSCVWGDWGLWEYWSAGGGREGGREGGRDLCH